MRWVPSPAVCRQQPFISVPPPHCDPQLNPALPAPHPSQYFNTYFPLAIQVAEEMRALNGTDRFRFMSQAWLQSFYYECPCADTNTTDCPALSLLNPRAPPLQCPSQEAMDNYTAAVKRGDIFYHAMPFNFEIENMSPELLEASLRLVREFDRKFDTANTTTASIRDVIYVTRSAIPILNAYGVNAITIGSNGANNPPQVPKLHLWRDEATGGELVVIYHPYGYGGYSKSTCDGPGHCGDCAVAPNGVACCTSFRTDNTGPPATAADGEREGRGGRRRGEGREREREKRGRRRREKRATCKERWD